MTKKPDNLNTPTRTLADWVMPPAELPIEEQLSMVPFDFADPVDYEVARDMIMDRWTGRRSGELLIVGEDEEWVTRVPARQDRGPDEDAPDEETR